MIWLYLATWLALTTTTIHSQLIENAEETDGQSSRKILGSSVVTSVSVVMETGNGKHTYYSDAVGHPISKPHIASQVASPINLLNPDRYEFYTFNDDGELVKRLMTLQEIQGIIAGGDSEGIHSDYNSQIISPTNDVSNIVENVQNVLKEEMEAHKHPVEKPPMDTPDVSSNWNMILPAFFGDTLINEVATIKEPVDDNIYDFASTEHLNMLSRSPSSSEETIIETNSTPDMSADNTIDSATESRTETISDIYSTNLVNSDTTKDMEPTLITTEDNLKINTDKIQNTTPLLDLTSISEKTTQTSMPTVEKLPDNVNISTTMRSTVKHTTEKITYIPLALEKVNTYTTNIINTNRPVTGQTNDYQKLTELVSIVTRPPPPTTTIIKLTEKPTTMAITFPQSTQITRSEETTQSSTLSPILNATKSEEMSSLDSFNSNIITNNDMNENNETIELSTKDMTSTENIALKLDEFINNLSDKTVAENENISVENYNTSAIENLLNNSSNLSDFMQQTVTVASAIIESKFSDTAENIASTISDFSTWTSSATDQETTANESTDMLSETSSITSSSEEDITDRTSTMTYPFISTLAQLPLTTMAEFASDMTPEIPSTEEQSTKKVTDDMMTTQHIKIYTLQPTDDSKLLTTLETKIPSTVSQTMPSSTVTPSKITDATISTLKTQGTPLFNNKERVTTTIMSSSATPSISTNTDTISIIASSSARPNISTNKEQNTSTFLTSSSTKQPSTLSTFTDEIMENITTPLMSTTIKAQTFKINEQNKMKITTIEHKITGITEASPLNNNTKNNLSSTSTSFTQSIPQSTASSTTESQKISATTNNVQFITTPDSIKNITNVSDPYRKNEESLQLANKTTMSENVWTPVQTLKPSEISMTKIPILSSLSTMSTQKPAMDQSTTSTTNTMSSSSSILTTTKIPTKIKIPLSTTQYPSSQFKPMVTRKNITTTYQTSTISRRPPTTEKTTSESYQSTTKVDLSSQGSFGMAVLSEDMSMFSKLYNELALKFWNSLAGRNIDFDRSAVVSPFGVISILAMIFLGARGGTSGEMNDVLKLDDYVTFNPHLVIKDITEDVLKMKTSTAVVRELFTDMNKGKVLDFYKARVKQFYDGHVEEVDFRKINNVIRRRTNALVNKQTKGKLPQYLEETTLALRSPLSALSTNIFQADCSKASVDGRDGELYFIVLPSIRQRRLVPIPAAVWRTGFIAGYDPELDATAVSIGTTTQTVSTIFVMPGQQGHSAPGDVLLRLESRLLNTSFIPGTWTQLLKSMLPRPGLEVQLPRFLQKSVINATESVKRMGLKEMFNRNRADLRGINGNVHGLYFADMLQINEFSLCGETQQMHTEIYPSAVEHLQSDHQMRHFKYINDFDQENEYDKYASIPLPLRPRQARIPDVPRLRFDRPFLYFVRHNPTGLVLHMGRFNPRLLT